MATSLGNLFKSHLDRLRPRVPHKSLTIIILTDGLWQGMAEKEKRDIKNQISQFVDSVKTRIPALDPVVRPISIQFVSFSIDEEEPNETAIEARELLDWLDNSWNDYKR